MRENNINLKNIILILIFIVGIILTGCQNGDGYKSYLDALEKTNTIERNSESIKVEVNQKITGDFKALEDIIYEMEGYVDSVNNIAKYDIYYFYDDLGYDIKFYKLSGDEQYLKIPMVKEYIKIDNMGKTEINEDLDISDKMKEFGENLSTKWNSMLKKENVFVGDKVIIENEDGSVKTRKFTIKPSSEQLEEISGTIKEFILENKKELIELGKEYAGGSNFKYGRDQIKDQFIVNILDTMELSSYEQISYVDMDGYIIDEIVNLGINYKKKEDFKNAIEFQNITIRSKKWDINKEIDIPFPEINKENLKEF